MQPKASADRLLLSVENQLKYTNRHMVLKVVRIAKAIVVSICNDDKAALIICSNSAQTFVSP